VSTPLLIIFTWRLTIVPRDFTLANMRQRFTEDDLLAILRARLGFGNTQTDLAYVLNVPRPVLSDVLNGKRRLTVSIASGLGFEERRDRYFVKRRNGK
jgi:hypothetical protein